jgi:insulysin
LEAPVEKDLHLPSPNPFIPDDFTIKQATDKFSSTLPILLRSDNKMKLWFKQDTTFKLPRAILNFEINSPAAYESPTAVVMSKLFCKLLTDSLNEYAYDADIAGLSYALSNTIEGLAVSTCHLCRVTLIDMSNFIARSQRVQLQATHSRQEGLRETR